MLKNTYRNLQLLKRISESSSSYRRDKFLNDWVVSRRWFSVDLAFIHSLVHYFVDLFKFVQVDFSQLCP